MTHNYLIGCGLDTPMADLLAYIKPVNNSIPINKIACNHYWFGPIYHNLTLMVQVIAQYDLEIDCN